MGKFYKDFFGLAIPLLFLSLPVCFSSATSESFRQLGETYYVEGDYQNAILEFNKAVLSDPADELAREYLKLARNKVRKTKIARYLDEYDSQERTFPKLKKTTKKDTNQDVLLAKQEEKIEQSLKRTAPADYQPVTRNLPAPALSSMGQPATVSSQPSVPEEKKLISGDYQVSFGATSEDFHWKRANYNLNERNWRRVDGRALNDYENTYDPAIYDQLRVKVDGTQEKGLGFYTNLDFSPWSFVGETNKVTVPSDVGGDTLDVQLKYWSNSRYTIDEEVFSNLDGDLISLPEMKVVNDRILPLTINSTGFSRNFDIPELEINREFWPLRELWFDYAQEGLYFKAYPAGLEKEAYTSDDPLQLSNHHIYWEESPWLDSWKQGNVNTGAAPDDFLEGEWDDSISFMARDSSGLRLTNLRGLDFSLYGERSSIDFSFASPKTLWQDYDEYTNLQGVARPKLYFSDKLMLGGIYAGRVGFDEDEERDATNQVFGADITGMPFNKTKVSVQVAHSKSETDITTAYKTDKRGNAVRLEIINSTLDNIMDKDYFAVRQKEESTDFFYKSRLALTHMDSGFESALSNYEETKNDMFWSRHLHFRQPFDFYYTGLYGSTLSWDDVAPFRIGDGVDYGRDVISLRLEFFNLLNSKLDTLFDVRNVHSTDGKFIENVSHLEATYRLTDKFTAKALGIYQKMPDTKGGLDPFLIDEERDEPYSNTAVPDGKDPSLKTVSVGGEYKAAEWLTPYFIWEHTNDVTIAANNYPRGVFNSKYLDTFTEENMVFRRPVLQLYRGSFFPQAPYPYYDIFRAGITLRPRDNLEIGLDWARNENEWAQAIDDNSNHIGFELSWRPVDKLGLYFSYDYTKMNDISELNDKSEVVKRSHHNFFSEVRYRVDDDSELIAQYGVGGYNPFGVEVYSPFGGSLAVLDTQHIVRAYYRKKF